MRIAERNAPETDEESAYSHLYWVVAVMFPAAGSVSPDFAPASTGLYFGFRCCFGKAPPKRGLLKFHSLPACAGFKTVNCGKRARDF